MITVVYGFLIGVFVSLIGGGGASLYLGILTSQLHIPVPVAAPTSLLIALPALGFGFLTQMKIKNVRFNLGNRMIFAAIPGIIGGTLIARWIPLNVYNWVVGLIFLAMGIMIMVKFFRHGQKKDARSTNSSRLQAAGFGLLSGLMVGIGGLSGGATTVGGLTLLGLSSLEATGTSTYVLFAMSAVGFISHLFTSTFAWTAGLGLMAGAIAGSIVTPLVLHRMDYQRVNTVLTPFLGILIIYFGISMIA
ncbi:sulfite exporter TauE/SafE family protein [Ligilactobacillus sp.]|uniref:sulfite exporter TauE/SafE family protein n=1 Tax=Ligilactobacillus sp. TaxID=2767921 RepID=UPI002FDF50B4